MGGGRTREGTLGARASPSLLAGDGCRVSRGDLVVSAGARARAVGDGYRVGRSDMVVSRGGGGGPGAWAAALGGRESIFLFPRTNEFCGRRKVAREPGVAWPRRRRRRCACEAGGSGDRSGRRRGAGPRGGAQGR